MLGHLLLNHLGVFLDEIVAQSHGNAAQQVDVDGAFLKHTIKIARVAMHLASQPRLAALLLLQHLLDGLAKIVFLYFHR